MTDTIPFFDTKPNFPLAKSEREGDWVRSGSCDQCASGPIPGACCTMLAFPTTKLAASTPDVINFWRLHGIEVKWWGDMPLVIIPARCSELQPNGDCGLFGKPERPEICSSGPFNPWEAKPLISSCSYQFDYIPRKE